MVLISTVVGEHGGGGWRAAATISGSRFVSLPAGWAMQPELRWRLIRDACCILEVEDRDRYPRCPMTGTVGGVPSAGRRLLMPMPATRLIGCCAVVAFSGFSEMVMDQRRKPLAFLVSLISKNVDFVPKSNRLSRISGNIRHQRQRASPKRVVSNAPSPQLRGLQCRRTSFQSADRVPNARKLTLLFINLRSAARRSVSSCKSCPFGDSTYDR